MTIYATAYDTTVGSALSTTPLRHAIEKSFVQDMTYLSNLDLITSLNYKPVFITGRHASEAEIPLFAHPCPVTGLKGMQYLCADVRASVRPNAEGSIDYKNKTEFLFSRARLVANLVWLSDGVSQLKNTFPFAGVVFGAWMSDCISKRYALDPKDQLSLFIISHLYYQMLFSEDALLDEQKKDYFAIQTMKATKASAEMVYGICDKITQLGSLKDYCTTVQAVLDNVRLKDFNIGMAITILGTSWYGSNAKEILAVALEHPPTWVTLVYIVLFEKTYKNSLLARVAERYGRQRPFADYIHAFENMLDDYTVPMGPPR